MTIEEALDREQREAGKEVTISLLDSYDRVVEGRQFIFILYSVPPSKWAVEQFGEQEHAIRYALFEDGDRRFSGIAS